MFFQNLPCLQTVLALNILDRSVEWGQMQSGD